MEGRTGPAKTVAAALRSATAALRARSPSASSDAALIVAAVTGRERAWLLAHGGEPLEAHARERIEAFVRQRMRGEPLAYVLGEAWFFGRRFAVDARVLVPRPETEHLVEAALAELRSRRGSKNAGPLRVCDVGTGSGAIALTVAAEEPKVQMFASDCSDAALALARSNAQSLGLDERVRFVCGDLAEPLRPFAPFDCVLANLPYVPTAQIPREPDPVAFEPRVAVDGGADGLVLYGRLVRDLPTLLALDAVAFFEAAPGTVEPLAELVARELPAAHVEIGEDYAGLERYVAVAL